ncbi:MAG: glycosyltransferase family 4 protein [Opitutaceae bacterium]
MRIAYLGQMADVSTENGISKKIRGQALHWMQAGHEVRYFSLVPTTQAWRGLAPVTAELVARGGSLLRPWRSLELARRMRTWRPDVIYFRYAYHSAGLPALFREIPTVAEINSDDLTEYPLTLSRAKLAYHRATRRRLLRTIAGFVPVTHELGERFAGFGRPAEVIANGIDLAGFPALPPPDAHGPLRLIFVGSAGSPWHGLERVAELARMFPEVTVDVVGRHAPDAIAAPNLRFHGPLLQPRYEPLLRAATAAIGTMASYIKRMDEGCPLKVREYLAAGLPVVAGYRDTDVPDSADYFLRLPNDNAPLAPHRERVAAWLERWRGRRVPRASVSYLDHSVKETRRLAFLHRFVRPANAAP